MKHTALHHRHSLRLTHYDYGASGAYFVTVCTHGKEMLFEDESYKLIVKKMWEELPVRFPDTESDVFVVMPNHVHGIIVINVGAIHELPPGNDQVSRRRMLIPKIVGYYKMNTAKSVNETRKTPGVPVWQRNYYERVLRDEEDLNRAREYIIGNPLKWELDRENPYKTGHDNDSWLYNDVGAIHELPPGNDRRH